MLSVCGLSHLEYILIVANEFCKHNAFSTAVAIVYPLVIPDNVSLNEFVLPIPEPKVTEFFWDVKVTLGLIE
jgi:hypothetical protein